MKRTHRRTTHTVLYVLRSVRRCLRTFSRGSFKHLQTQANTVNRRQASGAARPVERLAEDHANAKLFAERIAMIPGIALDPPTVGTNMVFFTVKGTALTAAQVSAGLRERGGDRDSS